MTIQDAINSSAASVEMEGYYIDEQCKEWCRQLLENQITMEQYIQFVLNQTEVNT